MHVESFASAAPLHVLCYETVKPPALCVRCRLFRNAEVLLQLLEGASQVYRCQKRCWLLACL